MSRFSTVLHDFRTAFADTPGPALDLHMVEVTDETRADPETVHRVRWELDRLARKREREAARQKRADATPVPEFAGHAGKEL